MPEPPCPLRSSRHAHSVVQGVSYGIRPSSSPPPQQWQLAYPDGLDLLRGSLCPDIPPPPQPMAYPTPVYGALLLSPSGCPHTSSSHLARTDLQSLSLSAQPPSKSLKLWCPGWWFRWSVWLSLGFAVLSPADVFSQRLWGPSDSADLSISYVATQDVGSSSPSQLPLGNASPVLILFVSSFSFLCFHSYVKSFLPFSEM